MLTYVNCRSVCHKKYSRLRDIVMQLRVKYCMTWMITFIRGHDDFQFHDLQNKKKKKHFTVHCQKGGTFYHCKLCIILNTCKSGPIDHHVFHICNLREAIQNMLNVAYLEIVCYCVFSLRHTSLPSASPPVYKHHGTLHCESSLPINLYLSVSVELRADIFQML